MNRTTPRINAHRVIYRGRIFRIERDAVTLGTGRVVQMEAVRHRGSVVLIPEPARGRVVLIRQYRYVVQRWLWELPAGSLEAGEAPHRAAVRECQEEIGLKPRRLERLGVFYPSPGFCDERMIFYRCRDLVVPRRPLPKDPDEQIEPRTFSLADAWTMVAAGDIADMKTVVGLTLLDRRRDR